jgi:hypothetical protein
MNDFIIQLNHDNSKLLCREVRLHEEFIHKLKINPVLKEELVATIQKIKRILDRVKVKEEVIRDEKTG